MNKILICVGLVLVCIVGSLSVQGAPNNSCPAPTAPYEELGCTAVFAKNKKTCPIRYYCPILSRIRDPRKCYYKNKVYNIQDRIPGVGNRCLTGCICAERSEGKAVIICAQIECPEFFNPPEPEKENCVFQYKPDGCCISSEVCDPDDIAELETCEWEGKVYREGERFFPTSVCKTCTCTADFDGTLNSKWCKTIDCSTEIFKADSVANKCAPVYFKNRNCCPIDWKCPDPSEKFVKTSKPKNCNAKLRCSYGNTTLELGQTITFPKDNCLTCTCKLPPLTTCIQSC